MPTRTIAIRCKPMRVFVCCSSACCAATPTRATSLDQLTTLYPEGSPVHLTQLMAQAFWDKYQETQDLKAACAIANAFANSGDNGQYLIVDDLNLFGYTNRSYTSDDMCPIK